MGCTASAPADPNAEVPVPPALQPFLDQMATATTVTMSGQAINTENARISIARALKRNSRNLMELNLSNCQLHPRGVVMLSKALETDIPLTKLVLSNNCIGAWPQDDGYGGTSMSNITKMGTEALSNALKLNKNLTYLDLSANHLDLAFHNARRQEIWDIARARTPPLQLML